MFELNTNLDFSDEDSNLTLGNKVQNDATEKVSDQDIETDEFTGFNDEEVKQSEEVIKSQSLMRKCSYCPKELLYQEHFRHEQTCKYKQYKASKRPSDLKLQKSPKRKAIQGAQKTKQCEYCGKPLDGRGSTNHIKMCKLYYKFIQNGNECKLCGESTRDFGTHMKKKHADKLTSNVENVVAKKVKPKTTRLEITKEKAKPISSSKEGNDSNCQFCQKFIANRGSKKTHERSCAKYGKFINGLECLICKKSSSSRDGLIKHLNNVHKSEYDQVADPILQNSNDSQQSGSNVVQKVAINIEKRTQPNEVTQALNEHICYDCNKAFEFEYELAMHKKNCLKVCKHCQVKVRPSELDDHQAKCYDAKKYISDLSCTICDLRFQAKPQVFHHVLSQHLVQEATEDAEVPDIQIKSSFVVSKFERLSNHFDLEPATFQTFALEEVDPRIVTKLYKCPICFAKLIALPHAEDHIAKFHRIPHQHFMRMGLEIEEIIVSNL